MNPLSEQDVTYPVLRIRGWAVWDSKPDGTGRVLMLCPLADFQNVPDGVEMESINGKKVTKGKDYIDDDTRAGLLAYGLRVTPCVRKVGQ